MKRRRRRRRRKQKRTKMNENQSETRMADGKFVEWDKTVHKTVWKTEFQLPLSKEQIQKENQKIVGKQ